MLEEFWLELAKNSVDSTTPTMHSIVRESALLSGFKANIHEEDQIKAILNTISSITFGNDKFFVPRWRPDYALKDPQYFSPLSWTYIYDNSPLIKTLEKYIDYTRLRPDGDPYAV